jgi:hypothetical protein
MRYPGSGSSTLTAPELAGLSRVRIDHQRRLVDRLERAGRHLLELVDEGARPGRIGRPAEVPVGAVVGQDQAVLLHGAQHDLGLGRVARDVVAGLEPEAGTHGREVRVATSPRLVAGRPDVRRVRRLGRHADGVGDGARLHLVVAHEARAGSAGPPRRPTSTRSGAGVGVEVPDRPGARRRARRAVLRVVELVEGARGRVDHDGVAVARSTALPPSMGVSAPNGYGPGSLSERTGTSRSPGVRG